MPPTGRTPHQLSLIVLKQLFEQLFELLYRDESRLSESKTVLKFSRIVHRYVNIEKRRRLIPVRRARRQEGAARQLKFTEIHITVPYVNPSLWEGEQQFDPQTADDRQRV